MRPWLIAIGAVIALLLGTGFTQAEILEGRVVRVVNGDTLVVDLGGERHRVGLSGIDTPERDQPWGESATREMRRLVAGKDVSVDWYKKDRGGRLIGNVYVDGEDAGLLMVERGMAWHYKRYAIEQRVADRAAYAAAEKAAQAARKGIWSDPQPIPPWEWRRR